MGTTYQTVTFLMGDDYATAMEVTGGETDGFIVHRNAETWGALYRYLMQWEYGEASEQRDEPPWGSADAIDDSQPGYVVSWNHSLGYVSLTRVIDED